MQKLLTIFILVFIPLTGYCNKNITQPIMVTRIDSNMTEKSKLTQPQIKSTIETSSMTNYVEITKDIVNILFFFAMAFLAYLTYVQAKKTVFSPIKTEIFKYQLKAFENVIEHFQNKREIDLLKDMDFDSIVDLNSLILFNEYVDTFFKDEIKINKEFVEEKMKLSSGMVVSKEYAEEYFQLVDTESIEIPKDDTLNDPALKLAKWNEKIYGVIHFTESFKKATEEIEKFQNSPLLPAELKNLLEDYTSLMRESLSAVGLAIEEASKKMPTTFPTKEKVQKFTPHWISNIFNEKRPKLEPKAIEILSFINNYLGVDELAKESV